MSKPDFLLLPTKDFINDFIKEMKSDAKSIQIINWRIVNQGMMSRFLPALLSALKKGTKVEIHVDSLFSRDRLRNTSKHKTEAMFKMLEENGAKLHFCFPQGFLHRHFFNFYKHEHRKNAFIEKTDGSKIAYFGASNFDTGHKNDYMIKVIDNTVAEEIEKINKYSDNNQPRKDIKKSIPNKNITLLYDRGRPFQSITFKVAEEMIKKAKKEIIFVSQMPTGLPLMWALVKAKRRRNIDVTTILPVRKHRHVSGFPYNVIYWFTGKIAYLSKIQIRHLRIYTHAKILIVDDEVIVGSHNLYFSTIASGCTEFSARIKDKNFLEQVKKFIENLEAI